MSRRGASGGGIPCAVWLLVALIVVAGIAWLAWRAADEAEPFLYDSRRSGPAPPQATGGRLAMARPAVGRRPRPGPLAQKL